MSALKQSLLAVARRVATRWRVWRSPSISYCGRDVHIGARCSFWASKEIRIGDMSYIGKEVSMETNVRIGRFGLIANRVAFVGRNDHEYTRIGVPTRFGRWVGGADADPLAVDQGVVVEDDVWIGFGSIVLSGIRIGRGSVIAAGALVTRDIPPYSIAAGVPARVVRNRFSGPEEIAAHEYGIEQGQFRFSERGYDHWLVAPCIDTARDSRPR